MIVLNLFIALLLVLLNAFFVLAEFSSVKARPTQIEALAAKGISRAKIVQYIQTHLDLFLSVCQIGITFASIGLGFVGEPTLVKIFKPLTAYFGIHSDVAAHGIAITVSYILISFIHIVVGEQVPKFVAIRQTDKTALFTAYPMLVFYYIFLVPIWILNIATHLSLKIIGVPPRKGREEPSEDEIRIILSQSQSSGLMSFRRLLYIENILDMGNLTVQNAMKVSAKVQSLKTSATTEEINAVISTYRFSRYPVIDDKTGMPVGFIHVKDLFLAQHAGKPVNDLSQFVRPCLKVKITDQLESVLPVMQRKAVHIALVYDDAGAWAGIITLEDVIEEVVGTIEEEFPNEPTVQLTSILSSSSHVIVAVEGDTLLAVTKNALLRIDPKLMPLSVNEIMPHITERERAVSSYVGRNLAIPHARLKSIPRPFLVFAKLKKPITSPTPSSDDTIKYLFILLTPLSEPRLHQIILARIAGIFESSFFETRLKEASTSQEIFEAISAADQASD
jgi:CBS domain containing-hemolysin-like protein/mannitol/fructose-specific phosphotransferase system IIA component (Ntr-type)